jgi:SET domain-containing protein
MFLIHTCVKPSSIHGVGVFAGEDLPAGALIWIFDETVDWRLSASQLASFPQPFQARLREYCYRLPEGDYVYCGDNGKYMNHSSTPNCDDGGDRTVTLRRIRAGEELTCDYRAFDLDSMIAPPAWVQPAAQEI